MALAAGIRGLVLQWDSDDRTEIPAVVSPYDCERYQSLNAFYYVITIHYSDCDSFLIISDH